MAGGEEGKFGSNKSKEKRVLPIYKKISLGNSTHFDHTYIENLENIRRKFSKCVQKTFRKLWGSSGRILRKFRGLFGRILEF